MSIRAFVISAGLLALGAAAPLAPAAWQPAENPLMTRWAKDVSPERVLPEYPRPQMTRGEATWRNLNGLWDYAIRPRHEGVPAAPDGQILVPFAIESALSGVKKSIGEADRLWYQRTFEVPAGWQGQRVLLHFGAVDWEATVFVNGIEAGTHQGGYDAFSFDITAALNPAGPQTLTVAVWDPTDNGYNPTGKQVNEPHGIWYTAVTGIWQTVWLEAVPETGIESLKITPDIDAETVTVTVQANAAAQGHPVNVTVLDGDAPVAEAEGKAGVPMAIKVANPKLWAPGSPHLYGLKVTLGDDAVDSYFGMRKIAVGKDAKGILRLFLNNRPLFQYGPLDQGWWPDGLYTAPTDEALRFDLEKTLAFGFNMIRKHVKVEPARWYYHCDVLGILVWQDMPSVAPKILNQPPKEKKPEEPVPSVAQHARNFEREWQREIDTHYNHPCIVMWVPFNEGWGQYDTARIAAWTKQYDPTRLVNSASGWTDRGVGDVLDVHSYPGPQPPQKLEDRVFVQGEFGGLGLPVENHLWGQNKNWGYGGNKKDREELQNNYQTEVGKLRDAIAGGTSAGVYTQTTDCEGEVNGLMTYDRAVIKFDEAWLKAFNETLYQQMQP